MIIIAIYTDSTRPRRYISSLSKREGVIDNNLLAELTADKEQAKEFSSLEEANKIITCIHNPCDRVYQAAEFEVVKKITGFNPFEASFK